jgi:hypothetical protein
LVRVAREGLVGLAVGQVVERDDGRIGRLREIVILDFFPDMYDLFRAEIDQVRERGVMIAGIAYRPGDSQPTMPYNGKSTDLVQSRWPGLGVILVVDASQQLVAQLSRDLHHVLNAVYSNSVFLSCVFHSALAADVRSVAARGDPSDPLKVLSLQRSAPPGLRLMLGGSLQAKHGEADPAPPAARS